MAKPNKTTENENSVSEYLQQISDEERSADCTQLLHIVTEETGLTGKMWGAAIVGFGSYHYTYESGRQGDAPLIGFASRVNALVLYFFLTREQKEELLPKFGKHTISKACIYIKKMKDIDEKILRTMIRYSVARADRSC
jgi:hypothetical protein